MSLASQDPARNLLFGLLAFQNSLIDRRALLAAFDEWTNDKSRPLGRVLTDQGEITEDLLGLIDGLVVAHLSKHNNEAEKSLASLTPLESLTKELEAVTDHVTHRSLAQVATCQTKGEPLATKAPSVGALSSSGTRFQILRPLNQGGMGVVSVALDTELDRAIALKEIRETVADDRDYRSRFLAEAEITGKLEHPGIIPIYGFGTYADGRPFYAMRLIRGDKTGTLKDAIERYYKEVNHKAGSIEFRGLLGRFLDVCNSVEYAHSKGVLHRDLKPDNVLLGPYGETLVVDWGLAKAVGRVDSLTQAESDHVRLNLSGSDLSPTISGGAFGTPEYAPPEQMVGDLQNIGPWSDVYALGAILYCLITGQAPFSRKGLELGALIQKIENGEFPMPRQTRPDADKTLEAICLKAMSRKPVERYESVRELANDIERWLGDEPVTAYPEPFFAEAARWMRQHQSIASGLFVLLLSVTVGLGLFSMFLQREKAETLRQAEVARKYLLHARASLKDMLVIADDFTDPSTWQMRDRLISEGIRHHEQFITHGENDRELLSLRATNCELIASASFRLELQRTLQSAGRSLAPISQAPQAPAQTAQAPSAPQKAVAKDMGMAPASVPLIAQAPQGVVAAPMVVAGPMGVAGETGPGLFGSRVPDDSPIPHPDFTTAMKYNDEAIRLYERLLATNPHDSKSQERLKARLELRIELTRPRWTSYLANNALQRAAGYGLVNIGD